MLGSRTRSSLVTTEVSCQRPITAPLPQRLAAGALGGVIGGAVFGMMMSKMGMLPMIASMLGSNSPLVDFAVHMMMSMMLGVIGGAVLRFMPSCPGQSMMFAAAYGFLLWVMGPLIAMPMMMGGPLFHITDTTSMSLMGHVVYAVVTLLVARAILSRLVRRSA